MKKKNSHDDAKKKQVLEQKIFGFINNSIKYFNSNIGSLKNLSSNIAHVQQHFDLINPKQKVETRLPKTGFVNTHLCLKAETKMKHTECDSSYTTICVPPHETEKTETGKYNKAEFEFNINDNEAVVLPLDVGIVFIYSGFMLTHRQQIKKLNKNVLPFINIVSYNSQKMFNHLMESFRREIKMDSKRKLDRKSVV